MCDYSLHHVSSRPAKIGDRLITRNFHAGTLGFAAPEDKSVAVCVLPGTELSTRQVQRLAHLPLTLRRRESRWRARWLPAIDRGWPIDRTE